MALEITENGQNKLTLENTNITFPSIYSRLELACFKDGLTMQVAFYDYQSKAIYDSGEGNIKIQEIPVSATYDVDIAAGQEQSLQLAHEKAKEQIEALGYLVKIIDLPQ